MRPADRIRELRYQPVNGSLAYREESSRFLNAPIDIAGQPLPHSDIAILTDLFAQTVNDLLPASAPPGTNVRTQVSSPSPRKQPTGQRDHAVEIPPVGNFPVSNRSRLRWYGIGDRIDGKGYSLADPMVYLTGETPSEDEASCIDQSLQLGKPAWEAAGALGYYPRYATLEPHQRANYLSWLATGRNGSLIEIGYAFLFFYGLERGLIIERQNLSPIVKECVRLLETYSFSGSFDGYLSRFLAFVLARAGIATLKDKWFEAVFEKSRLRRDEDFLAVALAWFFEKNAPLPVSWAFRLASQDPRSPRSIVRDRLPDEFNSLFAKRYRDKFGEGLSLKVSKRERSLTYRPASPSLSFKRRRVSSTLNRSRFPTSWEFRASSPRLSLSGRAASRNSGP